MCMIQSASSREEARIVLKRWVVLADGHATQRQQRGTSVAKTFAAIAAALLLYAPAQAALIHQYTFDGIFRIRFGWWGEWHSFEVLQSF